MAGTVTDRARALAWVKRALLLIIIGLVIQLFCLYEITPGSFMIYASFGAGLVGLGFLVFIYAAIHLRVRIARGSAEPDDDDSPAESGEPDAV